MENRVGEVCVEWGRGNCQIGPLLIIEQQFEEPRGGYKDQIGELWGLCKLVVASAVCRENLLCEHVSVRRRWLGQNGGVNMGAICIQGVEMNIGQETGEEPREMGGKRKKMKRWKSGEGKCRRALLVPLASSLGSMAS